jgi:DHA1 family tetracycline resistance protein-like MFS transporter
MHDKKHFLLHASPLFLVLLIDGMGLGLVFPLLNALMNDPTAGFFSHPIAPNARNFMYGALIGLFMLCWFLGAAILGDLSDQIGRKKSLIICLSGTFLGYLVGAIAIPLHSFSLLILSRVIAGLTSGSQPIAQAAIVDLSVEEHKTRNISFIFLALSLGFILGPLLGGLLSDKRLVSWFNFATAFYFAAILAFINMVLLCLFFKETYIVTAKKITISFYRPITIFIAAFKNIPIRNLSLLLLILVLGWSSFFSFISLFLLKKYHFTPSDTGFAMAVMGVGFTLSNGFLTHYVTKRLTLENSFKYMVLLGAVFMAFLFTHSAAISWVVLAPIGAFVAVAYSTLLTLFSNQVSASEQGWVMGLTGSIMALVFGIDGIVMGVLAAWNVNLPIIMAILCLGLSALLTRSLCQHTRRLDYAKDTAKLPT